MNNWKILTISVCFCLVQSKMRTLLSGGMTLSIRNQDEQLQTHDFDADANGLHLYEKVSPGIVLKFGGEVIHNNVQLLCDLGIGAESIIDSSLDIPISDPMSLYQMFECVQNIQRARWWSNISSCAQNNDNQSLKQCQSNYYCHTYHGFICTNGKIETISASNLELSGNINLNYVPPQLTQLYLNGNEFTEINLNGLTESKLELLSLQFNRLSNFDFDKLIGSSLKTLWLGYNQLNNSVNLNGLHQTKLERLNLQYNNLNSFDFDTLTHSSLRSLWLDNNQINIIDLRSLKQCKLEDLDLTHNQINVVDLSDLNGSLLKALFLVFNNITSVNFTGFIDSKLESLRLGTNPICNIYGWEYLKHPSINLTTFHFDSCETNSDYIEWENFLINGYDQREDNNTFLKFCFIFLFVCLCLFTLLCCKLNWN